MEIVSGLPAVERRMAEIAGASAPASLPDARSFSAVVQASLPASRAPLSSERVERLVDADAAAWGVDPSLIEAIVANESGFDPRATSPAGARGLMQLMPATAAGLGVTDAYDPAQNVAGGTRYVRALLDRFGGNAELAVAAYNAGPGAVEKYSGVPPYDQTRNYVRNVLASYQKYAAQPRR
ncbi:MAG: lytic transglycosylase domain-containing protein [Candidatus Tumulicola sp.]